MDSVTVDVLIDKKHPGLAAFVVVGAATVAGWELTGTTTVEATLDGVSLGRRSLHRWDDERWFVELRRDHLEAVGKEPGARATLTMALASTELPAELDRLLAESPEARARWESYTVAQQRMLREEILGLKSTAARERRARRDLLPETKATPPPVPGLGETPRPVVVRIIGRRLPGSVCGPYSDVIVGMPQKTGCDPDGTVSADVAEAVWETRIEMREKDGVPRFKGPAVNGPPDERFLYLTWIGRLGKAPRAMFRRTKLRLDGVPVAVLAKAVRAGLLIGRLDLTDKEGLPVCASVRPPAIVWSVG